jgi:hypothetical protein
MKLPEYKEKYRKLWLGEKNPNHKSNTTKLQRQLCSKYSREYWKKNFPEMSETEIDIKVSEFAKKSQINRLTETQLEYWINKGYSEEEAKEKLKDRQTTFSKEICIKKYGEIEGLRKWKVRNKNWSKKLNLNIEMGTLVKCLKILIVLNIVNLLFY